MTGVLPDMTEGLLGICCHGDCLVADIEVASNVVGPNVGPQELSVEVFSVDEC